MKYSNFYKEITGFNPYRFQEEVFNQLLTKKRIILQAPTGAGKTLAAIMPFLFLQYNKLENFPSKLIYSLPLRTLANSIKKDMEELFVKNNISQRISIQTGEISNDPKFLNELVFTTIDQSLSSYLNIPVGLSQRSANINAGAMLSSYLVFDEVHLLEEDKSLFTMINLLETTLMPFVIMTATLPKKFIDYLQKKLNATYIYVEDDDIKKIPSQKNRLLMIKTNDSPISAWEILKEHTDKTIVICNTVSSSQQIYKKLKNQTDRNTEIVLIHSRFLGKDRKNKEEIVKKWFGKESKNKYKDKILVATQVIEAGIDITCDVMHSEVAPIDSLFQRFGRCARYEGEKGKIFIWKPKSYAPYNKELCENTLETIKQLKILTINDTQSIQDHILTEYFDNISKTIDNKNSPSNSDGLQLLYQTIDASDKSNYRNLIRDIDSINVIVHPNPKEIKNPHEFESLSIKPSTLVSYLNKLPINSVIDSNDWKMKIFEYNSVRKEYKIKNIHIDNLSWADLYQLIQKEFIIVLNPKIASYSREVGFLLEQNIEVTKFEKINDEQIERVDYSYDAETWIEHARRVYNASHAVTISYPKNDSKDETFKFRREIKFALKQYAKKLKLDMKILEEALNLTLLLHDYGKLRKKWQSEARKWMIDEKVYDAEKVKNTCYGHTEYKPEIDKNKNNKPKFPSHAGVSAVGITPFLLKYFTSVLENDSAETKEFLVKTIISAIARHHSPFIENINSKNDNSNRFNIERSAVKQLKQLKKLLPDKFQIKGLKNLEFHKPEIDFNTDYLLQARNNNIPKEYYSLYQIFVRILRLSDSYSFYND